MSNNINNLKEDNRRLREKVALSDGKISVLESMINTETANNNKSRTMETSKDF